MNDKTQVEPLKKPMRPAASLKMPMRMDISKQLAAEKAAADKNPNPVLVVHPE